MAAHTCAALRGVVLPIRVLKRALLAFLVLVAPTALAAGAPVLVKDINTVPDYNARAQPHGFVTVGNSAYYVACDRTHGCELWRSDGTAAGTALLKDIRQGSAEASDPTPRELVNVNGTVFFSATPSAAVSGVWKTDGTAAGTVPVIEFPAGSDARYLTNVNGTLFFERGRLLWKSDGTAQGTVPVLPAAFQFDGPSKLRAAGGLLYFLAPSASFGTELWRSDGTAAGTFVLKDVSANVPAAFMTAMGTTLYFSSGVGGTSRLWKSDGTVAGTVPVKDVDVGCGFDEPGTTAVLGGYLYFRGGATCELWRSDGTEAGTQIVFGQYSGVGGSPRILTAVGSELYFVLMTDTGSSPHNKLWKTNGTQGGTVLVKDLGPDAHPIRQILPWGGGVIFTSALYGMPGFSSPPTQLWASNGTTAGTVRLREFSLGLVDRADLLTRGATHVYVAVQDDVELWKTDGTVNGTVAVTGPRNANNSSSPTALVESGGTLYFNAESGMYNPAPGIWKSDGTAAGTARADTCPSGAAIVSPLGGHAGEFYTVCDGKLYRTRGAMPPLQLANVPDSSARQDTAMLGESMLFVVSKFFTQASELWKTDGTPSGTVKVRDFPGTGEVHSLYRVGNTVYFMVGYNQRALWKTDGTEAGTALVKEPVGYGSFGQVGGRLLFPLDYSGIGITDGTVAGTSQVSGLRASGFMEAGAVAYFSPDLPTQIPYGGPELWKTDGTPAGTVFIKQTLPFQTAQPLWMAAAFPQGRVYFVAPAMPSGYALWRSDGTDATTIALKTFPQLPTSFERVSSTLYFTASDGINGRELWKTDGTIAGTVIAAEIVAGTGDSAATSLRLAGGNLFFVARSEETGVELYKIAFDASPDPFAFPAVSGVPPGSMITSNVVTVGGLEIQARIRVTGGSYSIGCTGTFTSVPGSIDPGQSVCVRHVAPASTDATTNTTLTIGDYSTTFTSRTVENTLTNPRLFAAQQYRDFLGREGEAAGVDFYEQLITSGAMTQRQVIEVFLASPEFQTGLPQVTRLYFAFFGRIPDYAGLMFQVAAYRSGAPIEGIAQNFSLSPEFTDRYGSLTDEQYVDLVYQNVLGRPADPGGRQYYLERLGDGRLTRGQMMIGFSESAEFQQIVSNEVYVIAVYVGMLRRTPEQAGLDFYVNLIENGLPRNAIIEGFLASPEYRGRFLP